MLRTIKQQEEIKQILNKKDQNEEYNLWKNALPVAVGNSVSLYLSVTLNDQTPTTMQVQHWVRQLINGMASEI